MMLSVRRMIRYFKLFVTTGNGLFQSFVFILIGMRTAEKVSDGELLISRCAAVTVLAALASSLVHRLQNNQPNNAELFSEGAECFRNSNSLHNGDRIYG